MQQAIAYYRVSTADQGRSGLGLEAQKKTVADFVKANGYELIDYFTEVTSGKRNDRLALGSALKECKEQKAILLIAKLDRLSRNVAFISMLMESKVKFTVVDNPSAEKFTLHILAAVAEKEGDDISKRTTLALAAAKRRGVELGVYGRYVLSWLNKVKAQRFAMKMKPVIERIKARGITTIRAIAAELNKLKVPTFYKAGHTWHHNTVHNLIKRLTNKVTKTNTDQ